MVWMWFLVVVVDGNRKEQCVDRYVGAVRSAYPSISQEDGILIKSQFRGDDEKWGGKELILGIGAGSTGTRSLSVPKSATSFRCSDRQCRAFSKL